MVHRLAAGTLLFIEPCRLPTDEPIIDDLTMRMTSSLRQSSTPSYMYLGVHVCMCGAVSSPTDVTLLDGLVTNSLCVHYLAFHRAEVPVSELEAVRHLQAGLEVPSAEELCTPEHRIPPNGLIWRLDDDIREDLRADEVYWAYELLLDNRAADEAHVAEASFVLGLDLLSREDEAVRAGWTLAPGEVRRLPHLPGFRVQEFRQGRPAAIAASLSIASHKSVTWTFRGTYGNGEPFVLVATVTREPMSYKK
jgi:hypothetical protein